MSTGFWIELFLILLGGAIAGMLVVATVFIVTFKDLYRW